MDPAGRAATPGRGGRPHLRRVRPRLDREAPGAWPAAQGPHPRALPRHPRTLAHPPARSDALVDHRPRHRPLVPRAARRPDDAVPCLLAAEVHVPHRGRTPARHGVTRRRRGRHRPHHPERHHSAHRRPGAGPRRRHAGASPTPGAAPPPGAGSGSGSSPACAAATSTSTRKRSLSSRRPLPSAEPG
jgi:hypothetical protein